MTPKDYRLAYKFIKIMKKDSFVCAPFEALIGTTTEQYDRITKFLRNVHQIKMI